MAGVLTLAEMRSEVLDNLSRSAVGVTRSEVTLANMADRWLNRAQIYVAREESLLYAIATAATVASQQSYAMPANLRALFSLRVEDGTNSVKLNPVMPWLIDRLIPKPSVMTTSRSSYYVPYKTSNSFELYPIPDATYTMRLRYSYWPATLSTASQVCDFSYMDDVIIELATMYGFRWLQETSDADKWLSYGLKSLGGALRAERDKIPDWVPEAQGYSTSGPASMGEYYNDPLMMGSP